MKRISTLLALISLTSAHKPQDPPFSIDGKPIHPACVYELLTNLADSRPIVAAVDIDGCTKSNRHGGKVAEDLGGWLYKNADLLGENGWFQYWHVGVTPDGVHVLKTALSGGGSGVFYSVLFTTIDRNSFWNRDRSEDRWILRSLGELELGDRTEKKVKLDSRALIITGPEGVEKFDVLKKP